MGQKRGRPAKPSSPPPVAVTDPSPPVPPEAVPLTESQLARIRLRKRWELASVLNFLKVFKEVVGADLKISGEEIETALIAPNGDLAELHIAILKGIPPVTKIPRDNDAWVTVVCKKLSPWWPWVAEGENPLEADHGEEINRYKELDPTTRMLILKALCELRALQDDILKHITEALKTGTPITNFRKERTGCVEDGSTYWCDGDAVVGYRLYKELAKVETKQKLKGKACPIQPTNDSQWETVAANLEEFEEISDKLSSSQNTAEAAVGEMVKTEIVPVLEELQRKKERALKRQQTQATLLDGFVYSNGISSRLTRERKPVKYTFDDYDKTIEDAIEISKKPKPNASVKHSNNHADQGAKLQDNVVNGSMDSVKENSSQDEDHSSPKDDEETSEPDGSASDNNDEDYDEKGDYRDGDNGNDKDVNDGVSDDSDGSESASDDDDDGSDDMVDSDEEPSNRGERGGKAKKAVNLRNGRAGSRNRNQHAEAKGHAEMKKRLRQRPSRNTNYKDHSNSDSDDDFI